jgi:hypothetical protein
MLGKPLVRFREGWGGNLGASLGAPHLLDPGGAKRNPESAGLLRVEPRQGRRNIRFENGFPRPFRACVVQGLDFPWVRYPPGNWSYQPEAV